MRIFIFLILIFFNTSLFARWSSSNLFINSYSNGSISSAVEKLKNYGDSHNSKYHYTTFWSKTYNHYNDVYVPVKCDDGYYFPYDSRVNHSQFYSYNGCSASCSAGKIFKNGVGCINPIPTCTDSQFLDSNNTCQEKTLPTDFPDSSKKGITGIREVNSTSADCVAGTKIDSGIAHAQVIGFDSKNNKCIYATFFCNNGLTWNKVAGTCEIPPDETTVNPNNDDISSALANACKSGKWAKSWTNDYCGKPLCYIGLNEQDYNLQCGNKYLEYDCTSDYRLKFYKQVSCGDVAKSDFKKKTLSPSSAPVNNLSTSHNSDSNISNKKKDINVTTRLNDDNSSITDYSNVVDVINGGLDNVDKSLGSLLSASSITNQKLSDNNHKLDSMNGKMDSMNGKLHSINGKLDSMNGKLHSINGNMDSMNGKMDSMNGKMDSMNGKMDSMNGKMDSMNGKMDITNNKLEDINKSLNPQISSDNNALDSSFSNASNFLGDVKTSLNGVETKFNDTKKLLDSGFKYTPPSVGSCVNPSTMIQGKKITLSICEPMQKFSPIFYLVFTIMFLYLSIQIFILGFRI